MMSSHELKEFYFFLCVCVDCFKKKKNIGGVVAAVASLHWISSPPSFSLSLFVGGGGPLIVVDAFVVWFGGASDSSGWHQHTHTHLHIYPCVPIAIDMFPRTLELS